MKSLADSAIQDSLESIKVFCKFLSANDTGETGGHQSGIYIPKNSVSLLFDAPCNNGENKEVLEKIKWQNDFETDAHFKYYGCGTRNEYRITGFGRGFPFLNAEYTGALIVILKLRDLSYKGYILDTDADINKFFDYYGLAATETNRLLEPCTPESAEQKMIMDFIDNLEVDFPTSEAMSLQAETIETAIYNHNELVRMNPDKKLIDWTHVEFNLFRMIEDIRYGTIIKSGFKNTDEFIALANQVLNRRKSRAGKSLENHLASLFKGNCLQFDCQVVTEDNKRPDFVFPSGKAYHSIGFPPHRIITLAAKTTCKDRWRQILNEADRVRSGTKYLCTMQQGISSI